MALISPAFRPKGRIFEHTLEQGLYNYGCICKLTLPLRLHPFLLPRNAYRIPWPTASSPRHSCLLRHVRHVTPPWGGSTRVYSASPSGAGKASMPKPMHRRRVTYSVSTASCIEHCAWILNEQYRSMLTNNMLPLNEIPINVILIFSTAMEISRCALYCSQCKDFVHDRDFEGIYNGEVLRNFEMVSMLQEPGQKRPRYIKWHAGNKEAAAIKSGTRLKSCQGKTIPRLRIPSNAVAHKHSLTEPPCRCWTTF